MCVCGWELQMRERMSASVVQEKCILSLQVHGYLFYFCVIYTTERNEH
jgi:hypothetical protein